MTINEVFNAIQATQQDVMAEEGTETKAPMEYFTEALGLEYIEYADEEDQFFVNYCFDSSPCDASKELLNLCKASVLERPNLEELLRDYISEDVEGFRTFLDEEGIS